MPLASRPATQQIQQNRPRRAAGCRLPRLTAMMRRTGSQAQPGSVRCSSAQLHWFCSRAGLGAGAGGGPGISQAAGQQTSRQLCRQQPNSTSPPAHQPASPPGRSPATQQAARLGCLALVHDAVKFLGIGHSRPKAGPVKLAPDLQGRLFWLMFRGGGGGSQLGAAV